MEKHKKERDEVDAKVMEASHVSQFKQPTILGAASSRPPLPTRESNNPFKWSNLGPLEKCFNNDARGIADEAIGRCIYANGLPFNLVRSPYWTAMIKAINESQKGYKPPGYEKVCTTLLTSEKVTFGGCLEPHS